MLQTNVVILCAGSQTRLQGVLNTPKQLIQLTRDETILDRTIRLVRENTLGHIRVAFRHPWDLAQIERSPVSVVWREIAKTESIVDSMNASRFDDETLFLLGDVVWSRSGLRHVFHTSRPAPAVVYLRNGANMVTGRWSQEIFAFRCAADLPIPQGEKLWDVWGQIPDADYVTMPRADWTDDIDSPSDYGRFLPKLKMLARTDG